MKTRTKLVRDLMRGDVIRTPTDRLDPLEANEEHVVVETITIDGEFYVQVEPNPFVEHWKMNPSMSIFVLREGAEVETPRTVETDAQPATLPVLLGDDEPRDGDDPIRAFTLARARLRALGFYLGAVRGAKLQPGDLIMVNGAGDVKTVEYTAAGKVKFESVEPAVRIDPSQPFLCMRPVKS